MNEHETIEENIEHMIQISVNSKNEFLIKISATKILNFLKKDNPEFFL